MAQYAKVILDIPHSALDRIFDYCIPQCFLNRIQTGVRVVVPFGRRNQKTEGYVISVSDETEVPQDKLKNILQLLDDGVPIFTAPMMQLAFWIKDTYFCTLSQALQTVMPPGIRTKQERYLHLREVEQEQQLTPLQEQIISALRLHGGSMRLKEVQLLFPQAEQEIRNLQKKRILQIDSQIFYHTHQKERSVYFLQKEHPLLQQAVQKAQKDSRLEGQRKIFAALEKETELTEEQCKSIGISPSAIRTLMKKGILLCRKEQMYRTVADWETVERSEPFLPTEEQRAAMEQILAECAKPNPRPILLHGVTGSGKTEIYLQLIAKTLQEGKQAIVLVPEISLTPQILKRFLSRFGQRVSVTHSRLSVGERLDQWRKAAAGEISVMIGPRSALFMPFQNLGMIIVDEVHENGYRSDTTPRIDARKAAVALAHITGAVLLMGSATPPVSLYYHAMERKYLLVRLLERVQGRKLPEVVIADMRLELEAGNRSVFSRGLEAAIRENLEKKQQTMLLLNRRGYATFVSCRSCGHVMTCPDCNLSYTYHVGKEKLVCHYCGREEALPRTCPNCGSKYIKYFGTGTQKIEAAAKKMFPNAVILRMDSDTTSRKGSHEKILAAFEQKKADILIGTQMIAKGHDFGNVTLVGILAAESALYQNSYAAAEQAFQLMTQAAGRAGRDQTEGRVYIQTYQPEHPVIQMAQKQDYTAFYEMEIAFRRLMEYPPFTKIYAIIFSGKEEKAVCDAADACANQLKMSLPEGILFGPSALGSGKRKGEYRMHLLLRGKEEEKLSSAVQEAVKKVMAEYEENVYFTILPDQEL